MKPTLKTSSLKTFGSDLWKLGSSTGHLHWGSQVPNISLHQNPGRQSIQWSQTAEIRGTVGFVILLSIFEPIPACVACMRIDGRMKKAGDCEGALTHILFHCQNFWHQFSHSSLLFLLVIIITGIQLWYTKNIVLNFIGCFTSFSGFLSHNCSLKLYRIEGSHNIKEEEACSRSTSHRRSAKALLDLCAAVWKAINWNIRIFSKCTPTAMRALTQHLLSTYLTQHLLSAYSSSESNKWCGKALAVNFRDAVNRGRFSYCVQ